MYSEPINNMSFGGLVFAVIVAGLIWFTYLFFIRRVLKNLVRKRGAEGFDYTFIMVERILLLATAAIVIGLFIMINPFVNSVLALLGIGIMYRSLSNLAQGIGFISELKLEEGKSIRIGNLQGIISKLGWTGLFINAKQELAFVSYEQMREAQVNYSTTEVPIVAALYCKALDKESNHQKDIDNIESIIFQFPLKINQHPVRVRGNGKQIIAEVALKNSTHLDSLMYQLSQNGYTVKQK